MPDLPGSYRTLERQAVLTERLLWWSRADCPGGLSLVFGGQDRPRDVLTGRRAGGQIRVGGAGFIDDVDPVPEGGSDVGQQFGAQQSGHCSRYQTQCGSTEQLPTGDIQLVFSQRTGCTDVGIHEIDFPVESG